MAHGQENMFKLKIFRQSLKSPWHFKDVCLEKKKLGSSELKNMHISATGLTAYIKEMKWKLIQARNMSADETVIKFSKARIKYKYIYKFVLY